MYDIRQFKPTLYVLVLLSIAGFALAAEAPALWSIGTFAVLVNAWLVYRGRYKPLPRIVSNLITLTALLYVCHEVISSGTTVVLVIGEFLMLLILVKLWEQRGNRDYAQLLILSLLLMVAAAISTASLFFALVLIVFLFLSLHCCLLFHLKIETDVAREAMEKMKARISPSALRQDQRYLSRSMRRLTAAVSIFAIFFAVLVFIFFPRSIGANMLGPVQFKASQSLVGFTDDVTFQNFARIQQNKEIVAYVTATHDDVPFRDGTLLLRGVTLDCYTGAMGGARWVRWPRYGPRDRGIPNMDDGSSGEPRDMLYRSDTTEKLQPLIPGELRPAAPRERWLQDIRLLPTGTDVMFAMAGAYAIASPKTISYRYYVRDGQLRTTNTGERDRQTGETHYRIMSSNSLGALPPVSASGTDPRVHGLIPEEIRAMAVRPEVSGSGDGGSLGAARWQRYVDAHPATTQPSAPDRVQDEDQVIRREDRQYADADDADEQIAANIENYLKSNYRYTLDLTDTRQIEGRDPLVAFLYDFKKGHCEYFAGAMTLMCQSLGMKARMCAGFRCNEYNGTPGADYFIVRQSDAHVWVEVFTKEGWKTFDPTSENEAIAEARRSGGFLQKLRHLENFLEYSYGNAIIGYNNENRSNLVQSAEAAMVRVSMRSGGKLGQLRRASFNQWLSETKFYQVSTAALGIAIALMAAIGLGIFANFLWQQWRLRKRAARIGINSLPIEEQIRLARQLEFYDELICLLERRQISRRPSQTPMEFSRSLLFLPAEAFETIGRLTQLFYRVRYGRAELTPARQRRLSHVILRLSDELEPSRPIAPSP